MPGSGSGSGSVSAREQNELSATASSTASSSAVAPVVYRAPSALPAPPVAVAVSSHAAMSSSDEQQQQQQQQQQAKLCPDPPIEKELGEPVIEAMHVGKEYRIAGRRESVVALRDVHLARDAETYAVRRGEFLMIRGPSGGGKTTLLNAFGTIDKITSGELRILDRVVNARSDDNFLARLRLEKIGFVFQTFNLLATMSAFENVELPMTMLGKLSRKERKMRAKELLRLVGLQDRMEHLPSELSGGEQQRVTIARSLANEPEVLLLDEPTGDLDTRNTVDVMDLLLNINITRKVTCIMVTHNPDIECYADRIIYIRDGRIEKQVLNLRQTRIDLHHYLKHQK